jgi:hypothetical protein
MRYKGNKSALYVELNEYKDFSRTLKVFIVLAVLIVVVAAIIITSKAVFADPLSQTSQQSFEPCLEDAYATIVVDKHLAQEIGGMDSTLPGMTINKNTILSARIIEDDTLEIIVFTRGGDCAACWGAYYTIGLILPK